MWKGQVTKDVFRTDAHILEINSKSGLYPLYVAYNIYRSRVEEAKKKYGEVGIGFAKSLWDATIEENIKHSCGMYDSYGKEYHKTNSCRFP